MSLQSIAMRDPDPLKLAMLDCSDWGNARRLQEIAGDRCKWIEDAQAWAHYDGKRWSIERGNVAAQLLAHEVISAHRRRAGARSAKSPRMRRR
jgi:putative DNA primase/helicase